MRMELAIVNRAHTEISNRKIWQVNTIHLEILFVIVQGSSEGPWDQN